MLVTLPRNRKYSLHQLVAWLSLSVVQWFPHGNKVSPCCAVFAGNCSLRGRRICNYSIWRLSPAAVILRLNSCSGGCTSSRGTLIDNTDYSNPELLNITRLPCRSIGLHGTRRPSRCGSRLSLVVGIFLPVAWIRCNNRHCTRTATK